MTLIAEESLWQAESRSQSYLRRPQFSSLRGSRGHIEVALTDRELLPAGSSTTVQWLPLPESLAPVLARVTELRQLPENWDSYGAPALRDEVILSTLQLLMQLQDVVQREPNVSLTNRGGLLLAWEGNSSLELSVEPGYPVKVDVYFQEQSGLEWEGPAQDCRSLVEWIWTASATD